MIVTSTVTALLLLTSALVISTAHAQPTPPVPPGFVLEPAYDPSNNYGGYTNLLFLPDGRKFGVTKGGRVEVIDTNGDLLPTPYLDINTEVFHHFHRGLIASAIHYDYANQPWLYLLYTFDPEGDDLPGPTGFRYAYAILARWKPKVGNPNEADINTKEILIGATPETGIPAPGRTHHGGSIRFADDGTMLITHGDGGQFTSPPNIGPNPAAPNGTETYAFPPNGPLRPIDNIGVFRSQALYSYAGKVLRIDPETGLGLPSNPHYDGDPSSIRSKVLMYGFRNPWRMFILPGSGSTDPTDGDVGVVVIGETGMAAFEEVNIFDTALMPVEGKNFGWPCMEGPFVQPRFADEYQPPDVGCDVAGTSPDNPAGFTSPTAWFHQDDVNLSFPQGLGGYGLGAIVGGVIYTGTGYPLYYRNSIFGGDFNEQVIRFLKLDNSYNVTEGFVFSDDFNQPTIVENDPETGDMILVETWDMKNFALPFSRIWRLRYEGGLANATSPVDCLTANNNCVTIPVELTRSDTTPVRAISVTFSMSPELQFCTDLQTSVQPGSWLGSGGGTTNTFKVDNGDGTYTIDQSIFGAPCGPIDSGTAFTVDVSSIAPDGTGSITVLNVSLRDCGNPYTELVCEPGDIADVVIDNTPLGTIADLGASQITSGNDPQETTRIATTWSGVDPGTPVQVFRKGYGDYPLYAAGQVPTAPATPADAINEGWTLTSIGTSGEEDDPPFRDFCYYAAFVIDACGNPSLSSNLTAGTLDYHLGDISDGVTPCVGDNVVGTADVSLLGAYYGGPASAAPACVDIGPTELGGVGSRPTPDGVIDFEDLIILAINFGVVSKDAREAPAPAAGNRIVVQNLRNSTNAEFVDVDIWMEGAGDIQGMTLNLAWDAAVVRPAQVQPGDFWNQQVGTKLLISPQPGTIDAAVMGVRARALSGTGRLATVRFARLADGDPNIELAKVDARDRGNRPIDIHGSADASQLQPVPRFSELLPPVPNPFNPRTSIRFTLARPGHVTLRVYAPNGRLVRTLVDEVRTAGAHSMDWDGTDSSARSVASGSYLVKLDAPDRIQTRSVLLLK